MGISDSDQPTKLYQYGFHPPLGHSYDLGTSLWVIVPGFKSLSNAHVGVTAHSGWDPLHLLDSLCVMYDRGGEEENNQN